MGARTHLECIVLICSLSSLLTISVEIKRTLTLCKVWLAGLLCAQYEEYRSLFGCCPMGLSLSLCVLLPKYFPACPVLAAFIV